MHEVADGVFRIPLTPRNGINAYLLGDVLVDAGLKGSVKRLRRALGERPVRAHVLTHAHADHAGGTAAISAALEVPVCAGRADVGALGRGVPDTKQGAAGTLLRRSGGFPPVDHVRPLDEGDEVGGFRVLEAPGHSPGHIALWRESDRVLVCGDVFLNLNLLTLRYGLHEPPGPFTVDVAQNRASARRLAALDPAVVLFGHGPELRDPAALRAFAESRPG